MSKTRTPFGIGRGQRASLAAFGSQALSTDDLHTLLQAAAVYAAEGLGAPYALVMERLPEGRGLLVRAGIGWHPGVVGRAVIGADPTTPGGYCLSLGRPVASEDLTSEQRFQVPDILREHGIVSAIDSVIVGAEGPFGVIEVDSPKRRRFTKGDIHFLQSCASLVGAALQRLEAHRKYRDEAARSAALLSELEHRVRNNLQLIASLLNLEARQCRTPESHYHIAEVRCRVETIRLMHEVLHDTDGPGRLEFDVYLRDLCASLSKLHGHKSGVARIDLHLEPMFLGPDTALPLGLIVNEFIGESLGHAQGPDDGKLSVVLERLDEKRARLVLVDDSPSTAGLPERSTGLSRKIIPLLARQTGAALEWGTSPSTALRVTFGIA